MIEDTYTPEQVAAITDYVDVTAPPPGVAAHFIFGTNQVIPVDRAAERYHQGLAPLIIVTGGINRHDGVVEGQRLRSLLIERDVPEADIRCEDRSANTRENVELALPHLREAMESGLPLAAVCKWYHRRSIHYLRTLLPSIAAIYAVTYEPAYSDIPITRQNWIEHPDGKRRVLREWQEVQRRVADNTFKELDRIDGAWR